MLHSLVARNVSSLSLSLVFSCFPPMQTPAAKQGSLSWHNRVLSYFKISWSWSSASAKLHCRLTLKQSNTFSFKNKEKNNPKMCVRDSLAYEIEVNYGWTDEVRVLLCLVEPTLGNSYRPGISWEAIQRACTRDLIADVPSRPVFP